MPKWTNYSSKASPSDDDGLMILDAAGKANMLHGIMKGVDGIGN